MRATGPGADRHAARMNFLRQLTVHRAASLRSVVAAVTVGFAAAAVYTGALTAIPLVTGAIVDKALLAKDPHALLVRVLTLVGAAAVATVAKGVHQTAFTWLGELGRAEILARLLSRLHLLPMTFFDQETSGRIQSHLTEDASSAARLTSKMLSDGLLGTLQLGFVLAAVATRYGEALAAALVLIPIYAVFPLVFSRPMRRAARAALAATAEVNTVLQESVQAVREVKIFGRELWSVERLSRRLAAEVSRQLRWTMLRSAYGLDYVLYFMVAGAVYWWGGLALFHGRLTVGELIAIIVLLGYLETPVSRLSQLSTEYQRVRAAADRLAEITHADLKPESPGAIALPPGGHRVCCEQVEFRYPGAAVPALRDVSFVVEPGERVAIVGPSGAGKTTLVGLLARLYHPQAGSILIDGRDLEGYSLASLRREIGFVLQDTMLFSGSVRDNIRFGKLDATEEEIQESSRLANAHGFIQLLGNGYDSEVGERGAQLSGGQRQRIAIARVLLRKPGTLVLDEATSALDTEAERLVREALEQLMQGRTTFIISHRPSAFVHADRILVLDAGRIVATGRHEELLSSSALYRSLVGYRRREQASRKSPGPVRR